MKIITTILIALGLLFASEVQAQTVFSQQQVIIAPYNGIIVSSSTNGLNKLQASTSPSATNLYLSNLVKALSALFTNATTTNFAITGLSSTVLAVDQNGSVIATTTGAGAGTVTSVAASVPTGLAISGSPITTSGTLAIALDTGYTIPTTTLMTLLNAFYDTPSTRITDGTGLTWSSNTLNCDTASGSVQGCLSAADWTTFNNKGTGTVTSGLLGQTPYYAANGTTVVGTSTISLSDEKATITSLALSTLSSTFLTADQNGNVTATTTPVLSGTACQTGYYAGSSAQVSGTSTICMTNQRVGVGTTTPSFKFDLVGLPGVSSLWKVASSSGETVASISTQTGTSTMYISSDTAGFGGEIILEDTDGAGCTSIAALDGALVLKTTTCP